MSTTNKNDAQQNLMPGYLLQLKAKEGKSEEIANALRETIVNIEREQGTIAWFSFRINETEFAVFDVFIDEEARLFHKKEGMERVKKLSDLVIEGSVVIKEIDVISAKFKR